MVAESLTAYDSNGFGIEPPAMAAAALEDDAAVTAPIILGLQPAALVDHVSRVDCSFLDRIPGERGGSVPVWFLPLPLRSLFRSSQF